MNLYHCIAADVQLGKDVNLSKFINLYGCKIGDGTKIGAFVEIQKHARVGANCKISSHSFICEGVSIEDNVFIGHGVTFINDTYPRATNAHGELQTDKDWQVEPTMVKEGASIGSGATILSNVVIGKHAFVGAGSVVTRDVPDNAVVAGNPARLLRLNLATAEENIMTDNDKIPFFDLASLHRDMEDELVSVFRSVLRTAGFVGGPMVEEFEQEFAHFCEAQYCVGVGSGTDALRFALIAAGVRPGDTVVTVPNTFIATTEAISQAGARPAFVDVDERTYNMDPQRLQEYFEAQCCRDPMSGQLLNQKTGSPVTAIVPVHLYGQMADMDSILDLAERYRLFVIEDACQAHGAAYYSRKHNHWKKAGAMGHAAGFSFYPGKNLGACGEAGAVTTNDRGLADKIRALRDHGQLQKYRHEIEGYNGRLDALQAGILRAKLKRLPQWNEKRRAAARRYDELFSPQGDKIILSRTSQNAMSNYHLYVIRVENRDQLRARLAQANIATQVHYPTPLHLQRAYASLGYKEGDFPVAEKTANEILSLPMYPQLRPSQQKQIAEAVMESLEGSPVRHSYRAAIVTGVPE